MWCDGASYRRCVKILTVRQAKRCEMADEQDQSDPELKALDRVADIFGKTLGVPVASDKIKALLATLRLLDAAGYGPLKEVRESESPSVSGSWSASASPSEEDDSFSVSPSMEIPPWNKQMTERFKAMEKLKKTLGLRKSTKK